MPTLTVSGATWTPANHRLHHLVDGSDRFDASTGTTSGPYTATAQQHEDGKTFVFWSWSGATETGSSAARDVTVFYPPNPGAATLTRWYMRDSDGPGPGRPGMTFDAFSYDSGDFLDWGDGFNPFTVNPASAGDDCTASTASGPARVTAVDAWPDAPLVFAGWVIVTGTATSLGNELAGAAGQSATAIATYASPRRPTGPMIDRIPPYIYLLGDPSPLAEDLARVATVHDIAGSLTDAAGASAVRTAVLDYLVSLGEAQRKAVASGD